MILQLLGIIGWALLMLGVVTVLTERWEARRDREWQEFSDRIGGHAWKVTGALYDWEQEGL